jgi:hypothetical protein
LRGSSALIRFTDLKLDNALFALAHSQADIETLLLNEPPAVNGEFELDDKRYPIMLSQPLSHKFPWDASRHLTELLSVYLTDFSHGLFCFSSLLPTVFTILFFQRSKLMTYTLQMKSARMLFALRKIFWEQSSTQKLMYGLLAVLWV